MTLEQERRAILPEFRKAVACIEEGGTVPVFEDTYLNTLLKGYVSDTSARQVLIGLSRWVNGRNVSDAVDGFAEMVDRMAKVLRAHAEYKELDTVEELADIAICCYSIAQMVGMDLDTVIDSKIAYHFYHDGQSCPEGA